MGIQEFEEFLLESRARFRSHINSKTDEMKSLLKDMLDHCCSSFEEKTLEENLQDEFHLYMEELKGA